MFLVTGFVAVSFSLALAVKPSYGISDPYPLGIRSYFYQYVNGTVTKIKGGLVFLKTDVGPTRTFGIKQAMREGIENIHKGDRLQLEVEAGNQIIDINDVSDKAQNYFHFIGVSGEVVNFTPETKVVTLRLQDSRTIRLGLKDVAAAKMDRVKTRTPVELQIDEDNNLVKDLHFL
jgi:hypothetical protein